MDKYKEEFKRLLDKYIFCRTKTIYLELSNICNYTSIHPQCPTSKMEKHVMPLDTIELIAKKIGEENYNRLLCPYMFSEPLIDPRLYAVIDVFKKYVPMARIGFTTNGFFLYDTILDELVERGVDWIVITAYFPDEYERLMKLIDDGKKKYPDVYFNLKKGYPLRKRMCDLYCLYAGKQLNLNNVCSAPYRYLHINCYGDVCLCCSDWKATITFGNLKEKSFKEILISDKTIDLNFDLMNGNRSKYPVCSRCNRDK